MIRLPLTRSLLRIALLAVALLLSGSVRAAEPMELDFRLLRELNERELFDYSSLLVEQMLARYPQARDRVLVAKAQTLYAARKSKDAEAAIAQIPKNSPVYPEAMLLMGEASCRRGKYDEAVKAYSSYFRQGEVEKRIPDGEDEDAVADFRRHVTIYKVALEKVGNIKEAQRVIALLGKIKGGADERGTKFLQLRTVLDAEEAKLDQHKPVNRDAVTKALNGLSQLVFMRDGVGALSYVETARAHVILGGSRLNGVMTDGSLKGKEKMAELAKIRDFIEAVKILKTAAPLLEDIVSSQGGGDELLAGALFYQGKGYRGQSLLLHFQDKDGKAEALMKGAAKCFEKVAAEFGDSRYQTPALTEHAKCSRDAQNLFDEKIELAEENVDAQLKLQLEQAQAFFQKKDYDKAIPVYLKAARIGRRSKKLPTVMSPLVVSMGRKGYFVEAEALASYLVEMLPKDETTALCVLQLGASLKEAAKREKDTERKAELEDRAGAVWEWFVRIAPTNSRAPMVAYAIADQQYAKALDLARKAKAITDAKAQEAAKAAARDAMTAAIPKFLRVVNDFGTSVYAPNALYNLGWCYYENGDRAEAADAFLRYADNDDLEPKYADQRLQAKFRAAECMMLGTQPEEAVGQFQELLAWTSPGNGRGFDPNTESAKRLRDVARMDVGYSYDQVAEQLRPKLTELRDQLRTAEKSVKKNEDSIRERQENLADLEKQSELAKQEFSNLEKAYTGYLLEFHEAAQQQAVQEETEDPDKMAPDLRARALENRELRVQKLEAEMEKQARDNTAGELATLRETAEKTEADRAALDDRIAQLLADIAELRKVLPKPEKAQEPAGDSVARLGGLATMLRECGSILERDMLNARKDLAAKAAAHKALLARIVELETKQRAAEDQATTLRDDVVAANDAKEKARLTVERDKAEEALASNKEELATAYRKSAALARDVEAAQATASKASAAYAELYPQATSLQWQCERAAKKAALLAAQATATSAAVPFAEALSAALDLPTAERAARRGDLDPMAAKAVAAYGELRDARIAATVLERSHISDQIETQKRELAADRELATKTRAELAPVTAEFTSWKQKGIAAFETYLKSPGSNRTNVAEVLAKLGTTYLELEDFAKAETVLSKLAKEHPDSPSGKGALFNLARAQYETGKKAEAAATFEELLAHPDAVSLPDLQYIGRAMLESGQPAVSLKACSELVARSERKSSPDYEEAQRIRGTSLFRAGRASLDLKKYDQAIKYMDTLLKENPKTGFFYEIKFATAEARRSLTPPDLDGAVRDLNEIAFATDPVLKNRADYQLGEMWVGTKDQELVAKGANRLRLVVDLADPAVPENLPWIEKSMIAAARAYARLGRADERDMMAQAYRERFPKGQYLSELSKLPAAEFGN
jgi:TolA-binding protein